MLLFSVGILLGLCVLVWSADRFVDGASMVAKHLGMSPLLIGMVIIGFGTSAPEMVVSTISSYQGNPGLALGNAYGSNITNIALILGITAIFRPIVVESLVLKKELPILTLITFISIALIYDLHLSRIDAAILLSVFLGLMFWTIREGLKQRGDALGIEVESELLTHHEPLKASVINLLVGLVLLVLSSRLLVWGAIGIAKLFGVSDVIVGLTVVAVGTSLPELASSIVAAKKGESDIALGNVLGSNLFNTLAVVGISGSIHPLEIDRDILFRDVSVMTILTLSLFVLSYGFRGQGQISRLKGSVLLLSYISYTVYLVSRSFN